MQYFEDLAVGDVTDCGATTVTKAEIIEFAEQFDPQPFHLDEAAAAESVFGGLVASGWHTAALCMRLMVGGMEDQAFAGARGVDELRWHRPLRPGTTLSVEIEVLRKDPEGGRPGLGHVESETRGYDDDGELLISWTSLAMMFKGDGDG